MDYTEIIITIITVIIAPCIVAITKAAIELLAAKIKDTRLRSVVTDVASGVETALGGLTTEITDQIRTAMSDGQITEAERDDILDMAVAKAERYITTGTMTYLREQGVDIRDYLIDKIGAQIKGAQNG